MKFIEGTGELPYIAPARNGLWVRLKALIHSADDKNGICRECGAAVEADKSECLPCYDARQY